MAEGIKWGSGGIDVWFAPTRSPEPISQVMGHITGSGADDDDDSNNLYQVNII